MKIGVMIDFMNCNLGLFHCEDCKSKWWGLRKKSLIPYPFLYYLAILNNVILRFAWTWKPLLVLFSSKE